MFRVPVPFTILTASGADDSSLLSQILHSISILHFPVNTWGIGDFRWAIYRRSLWRQTGVRQLITLLLILSLRRFPGFKAENGKIGGQNANSGLFTKEVEGKAMAFQ